MYFSKHLFFSPLHGGWSSYYMATDWIRGCGIIDIFHILGCFRFPESLIKMIHDAYGVK